MRNIRIVKNSVKDANLKEQVNNPASKLSAKRVELGSTGVVSVTRALMLLDSFLISEASLPLAELARRSALHKTTVLRLLRTLAEHHYVVQTDDAKWRLGPAAGWLGARYQAGFDVNNVMEPTLHLLVKETGETASFYIREGTTRSCVSRVEGPHSVRHNIRIGEQLPLHLGAPGRVILAFSGEPGEPYETVRLRGFHLSMGEREPEVSSVAAPVFGLNWRLLGSMCISGPSSRLNQTRLEKYAKAVVKAANKLSYGLAGRQAPMRKQQMSVWHP